MASIDYGAAKKLLNERFDNIEKKYLQGNVPPTPNSQSDNFQWIFRSKTQAFREVLIGCVLVRILNKDIDVHKPYIKQGKNAYSGRGLDENVVNPFLQEHRIPCSRGPFLSAFRRSVKFDARTREGLRDKTGFDALLKLLDYISHVDKNKKLLQFFDYLLFEFIKLRQESEIPISHIQRISLEQYEKLIANILEIPSGGRFPVLLIESTFKTMKKVFDLPWLIQTQGINVPNGASGVGGDITIRKGNQIIFGVEITERTIDKNRVIATFNDKILPHSIEDYLFFSTYSDVESEIIDAVRQYFSQGHEINFLDIKSWIISVLAMLCKNGRSVFNEIIVKRLQEKDIPSELKLGWNESIGKITVT